jgi:adenine deaminase
VKEKKHRQENMKEFIEGLPKAELHLHIEGTFEPELMFHIAGRNGIQLKFSGVEELKAAYNFNNLQEFLDIYYEGAGVLIKERDFYDLTYSYLKKATQENILHAEIFFDPQTHTARGIDFPVFFNGIYAAMQDAQKEFQISSQLILCFLRHLDEASAMQTLEGALPFRDKIVGVGLDSSELGNPPEKFREVFRRAKQMGLKTVAHAGEEGPVSYVKGALEHLQVDRIDHGNRSVDDPGLIAELVSRQIPLTLCPLSNLKLQVVKDLAEHPLKKLLHQDVRVTVNSDDPAYFGGYINQNYLAIQQALELTKEEVVKLAENSFHASFISDGQKQEYLNRIREYVAGSD